MSEDTPDDPSLNSENLIERELLTGAVIRRPGGEMDGPRTFSPVRKNLYDVEWDDGTEAKVQMDDIRPQVDGDIFVRLKDADDSSLETVTEVRIPLAEIVREAIRAAHDEGYAGFIDHAAIIMDDE